MRIVRWLVVVSLVVFAASAVPAAHAQYVGGQPPPVGPTDNGNPTQVLGEHFNQPPPANPVAPIVKHHSSNGLFTLGDILGGVAAIGVLSLLWFFFVWKRRRDDDEDEEGLPAPA